MDDLSFDTLKKFSVRQSMTLSQLDAVMNADTTGVLHSLWEKDYVAADPYNAHYAECIEKKLLYPDMPFYITFEGRAALEEETKARHTIKFKEFRAWATLIIALAAFIKSFFLN